MHDCQADSRQIVAHALGQCVDGARFDFANASAQVLVNLGYSNDTSVIYCILRSSMFIFNKLIKITVKVSVTSISQLQDVALVRGVSSQYLSRFN